MGLFSSKPAPPPPTTLFGPKTRFEGEISSKRDVELLGSLKGRVVTEAAFRVRKGAHLEGSATCVELEAEGEVLGEVVVSRVARFREGSRFRGTLAYRLLAVAPGARVEGGLKGPAK